MKDQKIIVKIQAPIQGAEVLIYNEEKTIQMLEPFDRKFRKMMNGKLKQYFWAKVEDGMLKIGNKAPWQEW